MKKKIFIGIILFFSAFAASAQLQQQSMGGSPVTLNTVEGGFWAKLYFITPKRDTLNNAAVGYVGAMTIRPQDTAVSDYPPIYMSNGRFWFRITSNGTGQGLDSINVSDDSLRYQAYNTGNQIFTFPTLMQVVRAGANVYFTRSVTGDTLIVNSVTGGTGNGLVAVGGLVLADSVLYVQHDVVWRINNVLYVRDTDTFFVVHSADSNYYRKDLIYIDSADGSMNYVEGVQDTVIAVAPVTPQGGIVVTIVDVFGSVITQPSPFVTNNYWSTAGNNVPNTGIDTAMIGTLNARPLRIITGGYSKITLDSTSKGRIEIHGYPTTIVNNDIYPGLTFRRRSPNTVDWLQFHAEGDADPVLFGANGRDFLSYSKSSEMVFLQRDNQIDLRDNDGRIARTHPVILNNPIVYNGTDSADLGFWTPNTTFASSMRGGIMAEGAFERKGGLLLYTNNDSVNYVNKLSALRLKYNGQIQFPQYTPSGFYTGDTTNNKPLVVDASGNINRSYWAGSGSGTTVTASNGLTKVGDDIQLFGTFTQENTLDLDRNKFNVVNGHMSVVELSGVPPLADYTFQAVDSLGYPLVYGDAATKEAGIVIYGVGSQGSGVTVTTGAAIISTINEDNTIQVGLTLSNSTGEILHRGGMTYLDGHDIAGNYTILPTDYIVSMYGGTATLPLADRVSTGVGGTVYIIKNKSAVNPTTVATTSGQTIDGQSSYTLPPLTSITVYEATESSVDSWQILSGYSNSVSSGTVTSIATGLGLSGGTITSSGTILVDTANASILSRQRAVNTYWGLYGNTGIDSAATGVGTTDAKPINFRTNGLDRMIVQSGTGYVGIGTTTPAEQLTIKAATTGTNFIGFYDPSGNLQGQIFQSSGTTARQFTFNTDVTGTGGVADSWVGFRFGGASNKIFLGDNGTNGFLQARHPLSFFIGVVPTTSATAQMTLTTVGLGINKAVPDSALDVVGGFRLVNGSQGAGKVLTSDANGAASWTTAGTGTVSSVSVVTANGVSGSVATATTTPAITITLGAITPTTVNGNTFTTGSSTYTGTAGQTYTFPTTTATIARTDASQTFTGTQTVANLIGTSGISTNASIANSNAWLVGGTGLIASQSTAAYITNGNNIQYRAGFRGSVATTATASNDVFAVAIGDNAYTEATSGTSALGGGLYVKTQSFTNGSGATTDFQNVYVGDAPSSTATNNWSINAGASKFRSQVTFGATTTSAASFNIPTGTAPSSPVDGDVWREDNTNTGLKIRVNGVTKTISLL